MKNKNFYLWIAILLLVFIKIFLINEEPADFQDSFELTWVGSEQCSTIDSFEFDRNSEGLLLPRSPTLSKCRSQLFPLNGKVLRLHYGYNVKTAGTSHPYRISLYSADGEKIREFKVPNTSESRTGSWNELLLEVGELPSKDRSYFLEFSALKSELPAISIRDRLDVLNKAPRSHPESISHIFATYSFEIVISILIFFLSLLIKAKISNIGFFFILLFLALGFHLSNSPFFYYDEWHVIQRFAEVPFPESVIYTHNEHFLPLFFTWFYLMLSLFGENYQALLVISCALLSIYAYVFKIFLVRLSVHEGTARFLAILFCVSSLHVEVMQWAFEQSILLCGVFGLCFLIQADEFLRFKSIRSLIYSFLLLFCVPLFFGSGFAYFPIAIVLMTLVSVILPEIAKLEKLKRITLFILVNSLAVTVPLLLYVHFNDSSTGHAINENSFFSEPLRFFAYLLEGIGLGSVLRPIGFYPVLSLTSPQEIINESLPFLRLGFSEFDFSMYSFIATLGLLVALGICAKNTFGVVKTLVFGLSGCSVIVVFFIIFTAGRWSLGANQSLALRYQVQVLPGFFIIIAPFIESVLSLFKRSQVIYIVSFIMLFFWILIQTIAISSFSYFKYNGDKDRIYIHAAVNSLDREGKVISGDAKSLPLHEPGITPGRGLLDLNRAYYWLLEN